MRLIDAITVGCAASCSAVEVGSYGASREEDRRESWSWEQRATAAGLRRRAKRNWPFCVGFGGIDGLDVVEGVAEDGVQARRTPKEMASG
jgi:hypothetical protein